MRNVVALFDGLLSLLSLAGQRDQACAKLSLVVIVRR